MTLSVYSIKMLIIILPSWWLSSHTLNMRVQDLGQVEDLINDGFLDSALGDIEALSVLELGEGDLAKIQYLRGRVAEAQGNWELAGECYQNALLLFGALIKQGRVVESHIQACYAMAKLSVLQGKYESALIHEAQAAQLLQMQPDAEASHKLWNLQGVTHYHMGRIDSALHYFNKVLHSQGVDANERVRAITNIATLQRGQGQLPEALEKYHEALKLSQLLDYAAGITSALGAIGQVYYAMHDFDSAASFFHRKLRLQNLANDGQSLAYTYADLGDVYKQWGEWDSAQAYYQQSLRIREDLHDLAGEAYVLERLGDLQFRQGKLNLALQYIDRGLAISTKEGLPEENLLLLVNQARVLTQMGRLQEALVSARLASRWADSTGRLDHANDAAEVLYPVLFALGQYRQAYQSLLEYQQLEDSIRGEAITRRIARLEYQYQAEQDRRLFQAEQERERMLYAVKLRTRNWIVAGAILSLGLAAWLAFVYRSFYRRQQHQSQRLSRLVDQLGRKNEDLERLQAQEQKTMQETLAIKDSALAAMAMSSQEKDAVLEQITNRVQKLESQLDEESRGELRSIHRDLSETVNREESWDSFLHRFEAVHPEFFQRLKKAFPILTNNDLKLAAYVKVGMTNKDIAQVSHLALSSVKKSVNRLKKKLELGPEESIRDFMLEF